jgi:hypothetical protein
MTTTLCVNAQYMQVSTRVEENTRNAPAWSSRSGSSPPSLRRGHHRLWCVSAITDMSRSSSTTCDTSIANISSSCHSGSVSSTFHPTRVASQPTRYIRTRLSIRPQVTLRAGPSSCGKPHTRSPASVRGYYSSSFLCSPRDPWNRDRVWRLVQHLFATYLLCFFCVCVRATCTTLWLPLRVPWPQHGARAPRGFAFPFPYQPSACEAVVLDCATRRAPDCIY